MFDAHADEYDRWFTEHATIYEAEVEAVRRIVPSTGVGVETAHDHDLPAMCYLAELADIEEA